MNRKELVVRVRIPIPEVRATWFKDADYLEQSEFVSNRLTPPRGLDIDMTWEVKGPGVYERWMDKLVKVMHRRVNR